VAGTDLQLLPASHGINRWLSSRLGTLVRTRTDLVHQSVHSPTRLGTVYRKWQWLQSNPVAAGPIPMRVSCWWTELNGLLKFMQPEVSLALHQHGWGL